MKNVVLAVALATGACCLIGAQDMQMAHGSMKMDKDGKPIPSPRKMAMADLGGTSIHISYGAPSLRGRKMVGGQDPYGKEWRLGANEATSFETSGDLMVGGTHVPAGKYTLFALPEANKWTLIISKKTGEWGIPYPGAGDDLARVPMQKAPASGSLEQMLIDFEKSTAKSTQMHVKWATDNYYVTITKM
ncbi:DUF2911 domain-containing protein [Terriglobus aquaticus]|uniref:DUF2911 domain-containing protein n=1 Tax=Terriglobus aquaticus TaxID=940139 RepID=A0ABW9KHD1_9BACT|nr:DUF2911 domain-containing protein [Terriglobus aquaticus]